MGVLRPVSSLPTPRLELDAADDPALLSLTNAASGPGRSEEPVDPAVTADVDVVVLAELVLSERCRLTGREDDVEIEAPPTDEALVAAVEEVVEDVRVKLGVGEGRMTVGDCVGATARPDPSETARSPPEEVEAVSRSGGAPSPNEPLTTSGLSPSRSKRERRLLRSACGIALFCETLPALLAAPLSKAAIRDLSDPTAPVLTPAEPFAGELDALPVSDIPPLRTNGLAGRQEANRRSSRDDGEHARSRHKGDNNRFGEQFLAL